MPTVFRPKATRKVDSLDPSGVEATDSQLEGSAYNHASIPSEENIDEPLEKGYVYSSFRKEWYLQAIGSLMYSNA